MAMDCWISIFLCIPKEELGRSRFCFEVLRGLTILFTHTHSYYLLVHSLSLCSLSLYLSHLVSVFVCLHICVCLSIYMDTLFLSSLPFYWLDILYWVHPICTNWSRKLENSFKTFVRFPKKRRPPFKIISKAICNWKKFERPNEN